MNASAPERYVPDTPFPEYGYVPGYWPHPERDPDGHSYGESDDLDMPLDPENWMECKEYLYGIDLFNHGYYWEAHESWEQLWHAEGRTGTTADFLRALIKFAAAGVKVRTGNARGVSRHAEKARSQFSDLKASIDREQFAGLHLEDLIAFAEHIEKEGTTYSANPEKPHERVFEWTLQPTVPEAPQG